MCLINHHTMKPLKNWDSTIFLILAPGGDKHQPSTHMIMWGKICSSIFPRNMLEHISKWMSGVGCYTLWITWPLFYLWGNNLLHPLSGYATAVSFSSTARWSWFCHILPGQSTSTLVSQDERLPKVSFLW